MSQSARPQPRLPLVVRLAALLSFEVGSIAALHWVGRYEFLQIPWSDLDRWLRDAQPEDALAAVIRLVALVLGYWMLATTLAYVAGRLVDAPRALRTVSWLMLPGARRVIDAVLALSITASSAAAAIPAATSATTTAQEPQPDREPPPMSPPEAAALKVAIYPQTTPLPAPSSAVRTYRVQSGDSLREIAAQQLGDVDRWRDIWRANRDRLETAGLAPDARPEIGWDLVVPSQLLAAAWRLQEQAGTPAPEEPGGGAPPTGQVTVQPGDNLWTITEDHLADRLGREPTAPETAPHWQQTIDTNLPNLRSGDPDLIYPGEQVTVGDAPAPPAPPGPPPPTPSAPTEPGEPAPSPRAEPPTTSTTRPPTPTTTETAEPTTPSSSSRPPPGSSPSTTTPSSSEPDRASPSSPEDDDPSGVEDVLVPVGISAGLAAVTLGALARRRRARRRSAKPGSTTGPRPAEDIDTELALATASGNALERAWRVAQALAAPLRSASESPVPIGIVVRPNGDIAVHLAEPATPTEPFTAEADPSIWVLPADTADLTESDRDVPVLETLVALGYTDDGAWVFVDLETLGATCIDGDPTHATQLARSLVAELALQPLHHYIHLTVVGDIEAPDINEQGVMTVDHLDEDTTQLIQRLATETADLLAVEQAASTAHARLQGVPRDGLFASAFIIGPGADPVLLDRAARAAIPGGRGLAIVALDPLEAPATQLVANSDGTLDVPHLGLIINAAGLAPDELHRVDDLLRHEPDTVKAAMTTRRDTAQPSLTPEAQPEHTAEPHEEPPWERCVRIFADHRVETRDGDVISFRHGDNPTVVSRNAQRGPELVAYLALRPDRSATLHEIADHLWWGQRISDQTIHKFVSGTRRVLGGARYLSQADGNDDTRRRYTLATTVVTDHELLDRVLNYARTVADTAPDLAIAALRPHLEHIETKAFRDHHLGAGLAEWANAHRVIDRVEQTVIEAALLAAQLYTTRPDDTDLDSARWAIDQALNACPTNEALTRAAMELEAQAGHPDAATRRYHALNTHLIRDDLEPEDETVDLHRRITRPDDQIG